MRAMGELVAFLRVRLDEDEGAAQAAGGKAWRWEQHYGDMCNDPTCEYGELATDDTVLMNVHAYDIRSPWQGAGHIERHHPARVLAEVEARRRILARHTTDPSEADDRLWRNACKGCGTMGDCDDPVTEDINECPELRDLATVYADHPDYREEWRP